MRISLQQGLWRDGAGFTTGVVRVLNGQDEALVADAGATDNAAVSATGLIVAACSIDGVGALTSEDARLLSIGDRERMLLALYRANFGEQLQAVVQCPRDACSETVEFELTVTQLLQATGSDSEATGVAPPTRTATLVTGCGKWQVCFRVPNGGDQELAAQVARSDPAQAVDLILGRCVAQVRDASGQPLAIDSWLPALRESLSQTFADIDRQANVSCALCCPACQTEFATVVDAAAFLMRELVGKRGIFAEVDQLARTYHWSESDILALPVVRRRRYLAMVTEAN
jgi:hypothetical protein